MKVCALLGFFCLSSLALGREDGIDPAPFPATDKDEDRRTIAQKKKRRSVKRIQSEYLDMKGPGWMRVKGARMS